MLDIFKLCKKIQEFLSYKLDDISEPYSIYIHSPLKLVFNDGFILNGHIDTNMNMNFEETLRLFNGNRLICVFRNGNIKIFKYKKYTFIFESDRIELHEGENIYIEYKYLKFQYKNNEILRNGTSEEYEYYLSCKNLII